jgi:transcriptional regulator with XRE-family HTH domain|nr:MAG TPA: helix-turn-helix domain protein [Caudoviricetes sp.]
MKFGEKLKSLREQNNLTQAAVAKALGVTQRTISYYETNNVIPNDPSALNKLATLFGVTLDELLLKNDGPKSKIHALIEKLIADTENKLLTWQIFETVSNNWSKDAPFNKFDPILFPQYKEYTFLSSESYFAEYDTGGYLIEKLVSPSEEIDIAAFIFFNDTFSYLANKDSVKKIEDLYLLLSNITPGISSFIDQYLNDDLSQKNSSESSEQFGNEYEDIPF